MVDFLKRTTCCFTGHRPEKMPWRDNESDPRCAALKQRIRDALEALYMDGYVHFMCGMARGGDMYFCEEVLRLRSEHPEVTLEAVIPCEEQAIHWPEADRHRYFRLVADSDRETLLQSKYTDGCMEKRNKYMVDRSSALIAAFNGTIGGTMQTVNYAKKSGIRIIDVGV